MTAKRGSVRYWTKINAPADAVWAYIGDPLRLPEWFPGVTECSVNGMERTINTQMGLPMVEDILTNNPIERRFQYRIKGGFFVEHLSTLDVFDLGDNTCIVSYSCDAQPAPLALVIAGGASDGLQKLKELTEGKN
jgi:carbon monoxide dehydrogenase subunit G